MQPRVEINEAYLNDLENRIDNLLDIARALLAEVLLYNQMLGDEIEELLEVESGFESEMSDSEIDDDESDWSLMDIEAELDGNESSEEEEESDYGYLSDMNSTNELLPA